MDMLRIPPTDLGAFLAERTERLEKFRQDRDRPLPTDRETPRRRTREDESDEESDQRGAIISVDA